jgi:thiamine transporter ThiT
MANPLMYEGPIPAAVHGVVEYIAGVVFIAAPLLFEFEARAAVMLSIAIGIVVLLIAATTTGATGLITGLSLSVHVVLDYVLAVGLIVAPFLFRFTSERNETVFFLVVGVVHLLLTVATRFVSTSKGRL